MADKRYEAMHFPDDGQPIVYIREVDPEELPPNLEIGEAPVYAVHDAAGNRLALAADRDLAFALARRNDMMPMSVH